MAALTDVFPLEEFRILGPIGKGEFGKVHRATWRDGNVDIALKHIEASQGEVKLAAEQEGVRLQTLVWQYHPDIVPRVYRNGTAANGDYFIAMEFVRGESLHDILRRKRLSAAESIRLTTILAGFLQRMHAFLPPILHSDLKPEHVLVLDDGTVKVIDFGIARRPDVGAAATHNAFLSVMYAAPERVEDEARNVHPTDDLWALGVMLFEMLAGCHPREEYRMRIEDAVRADDLVTVATLLRERPGNRPADCSPQLDAIVRKLLAPQPGHRYASATQLLADFDSYARGQETLAWQQLVAAGRATRVVSRPRSAAPGSPTMPVPPPLPEAARVAGHDRGAGLVRPVPNADLIRSAPQETPAPQAGFPSTAPPRTVVVPALPAKKPRRRLMSRRSLGVVFRALAALLVARVLIGEAAVWSRTERFRGRIESFSTSDLPSIPPMVRSLRNGAVFGFGASRADRPLANRMLELAEPTIADYRTDMPVAKLPQWKAASAALTIATDVRPGDRRLRSRARYVDGHLLRIDAQGKSPEAARPILEQAVAAFREAGQLDSAWPDPFIGLAAVHAYGLRDPDAVVQDVGEAARRGFSGGRREHAEVADAFSYRADQQRGAASRADGDERHRLLSAALADYQSCVDNYTGVIGFFNSDRNLERCRRLHDTVAAELAPAAAAAFESVAQP